ncbi:MAG: major facilitator superfamily domain-containing protein [Linnemannia gamsii]|nr:MAG: major facilitator superfamily domain-containing protein [Linnemannia gamsii]
MQPSQQHSDYSDTDERRPLLSSRTPSTWSIAITTLGFDHDHTEEDTTYMQASKLEEEKERRWFVELKRRPWRKRPSSLILAPWLMLYGMVLGMCSVPLDLLKAQVICQDMLSSPNNSLGVLLGSAGAGGTNIYQLAPIDQCQTETVLRVIHLLESRIGTLTGIGILLSLAKWCSTSDVYGRKLLLHVGLGGMAACIMIGWLAASRFNHLGPNIYYLEVVALTLMPAPLLINTAVFTYIADCTRKGQRSLIVGYLVTSMSSGSMIGSIMSTYFSTVTGDLTVPLRISLILLAFLAVYLSILPESFRYTPAPLPCISNNTSDSINSDRGGINPTATGSSLWAVWGFFNLAREATCMIFEPIYSVLPGRIPKSVNMSMRAAPAIILFVHLLSMTANYGSNRLIPSMAKVVFQWDAFGEGHYLSFIPLCIFVTFFGVFPALRSVYIFSVQRENNIPEELQASNDSRWSQDTRLHRSPDNTLIGIGAVKMDMFFIAIGLLVSIVGHLVLPLFPSIPVLYLSTALSCIGMISGVSCAAVLASIVPSHLIGAAYGAYSISESLGGIIGDFTYGPLFVHYIKTSPLFYCYVSAGLCTLALCVQLINWWSYSHLK